MIKLRSNDLPANSGGKVFNNQAMLGSKNRYIPDKNNNNNNKVTVN